jgi:hypothetical protein
VVVASAVAIDLTANLTARRKIGVHVGVRDAGAHGRDYFGDFACSELLRR